MRSSASYSPRWAGRAWQSWRAAPKAAAARWARTRLEGDSSARIGIVVPDLAQSRNAVRRIFAQVMEPARPLPGGGRRPLPFNLSPGEPLSSYPLVAAALRVLELARHEVEFERASGLIRSPF